ncbi:MAG: D-galactonate transporter [Syntrophorhabdus sp. PtaU1.Bin058]|nr:MAG: D-galactonate transporter [Syntrophorhabdus sp. PtaU1.Bin058]
MRPILVFATLSSILCLSMFYRVTNAVISPDLIRDLHLNAERLGTLGSAFFYSFALCQIPMGVLLDKIGPRIIITFFSLIGASGAIVFGSADSFASAFAGRTLLGIGMASALMGSLKVFVLQFPAGRFAILSGTIISIGTLGNILATSPLAYLNATIGWRQTLLYAGGINIILAVLLFWVLKGDGRNRQYDDIPLSAQERKTGVLESFRLVVSNLSFWQLGAVAFFRYGTLVALQGLWLGPYFMDIKGLTQMKTGNLLMMLSLGTIVGSPTAGYLTDRVFYSRKTVILMGLGLYSLCLVPLTGIFDIDSPLAFSVLLFFIGVFSSFGMLAYTHIKELFPLNMSGTAISGVNFFVISGGAVLMQVIGIIVEGFVRADRSYPPQAYHTAFFICLLGMVCGLLFYAFSKDSHRPH